MSDRGKKIFLILTIVVPFLLYCVYYYSRMIKNAPYKFTEFKSIVFKYGNGDSMVNKYNSATGEYQYLNKHDSLIKVYAPLTIKDEKYLHQKAAELGFWDFPSKELNSDSAKLKGEKPPRYYIEFNYKRKSKKVIFDSAYDGDYRLVDANKHLIEEILHMLADAEERQKR